MLRTNHTEAVAAPRTHQSSRLLVAESAGHEFLSLADQLAELAKSSFQGALLTVQFEEIAVGHRLRLRPE